MNGAPTPAAWPGWRILGLLFIAFFTLGAGWSLTTAPGGAPDEVQHSFRASGVWSGQLLNAPLPTGGAEIVIPRSWTQIESEIRCFTGQAQVPASCAHWPDDPGPPVSAGNSAGRYNPVYYLLVGLPFQFFPPTTALYLARLLSALIMAALLTGAASAVILRGGSVMARAGLVAALTPMALFLGGSVNPSGMEIAGAIAGWAGLLCLARHPNHPATSWFAVVTAVGLSGMVVARPASFLWLLVPAAVFMIAAPWSTILVQVRRRAVLVAAGSVVVVTAGCLVWNSVARTSDVGTGAGPFGGLADGVLQTYLNSGDWWPQEVGVLGWLDTQPPTGVLWATVMLVGVLVVPALVGAGPRMRLALLAAVAAAILVPMAAQAVLYPQTGLIWQGRYGLPLTVGVVVLAGFALDEARAFESAFAARLLTACLVIWAGAGVVMAFYNLQRYATGSAGPGWYKILWQPTPWAPPGGSAVAMAVVVAGYGAVSVALARLGRPAPNADRSVTSPASTATATATGTASPAEPLRQAQTPRDAP
ncbi:DUF2142 domain-containing protein [Nakamurella sp.]|uniref:DUF2142 domain-containing protein n=1 Tax=Nakamurella sp. TaxID=1869182 RepID=UPI00378341DB